MTAAVGIRGGARSGASVPTADVAPARPVARGDAPRRPVRAGDPSDSAVDALCAWLRHGHVGIGYRLARAFRRRAETAAESDAAWGSEERMLERLAQGGRIVDLR